MWVPFALASKVMPESPNGAARSDGASDRAPRSRRVGGAGHGGDAAGAASRRTGRMPRLQRHDRATPQLAAIELDLADMSRGISPQRRFFRRSLLTLMAFVALLVVVGCANVANLLLARSSVRQRELAVRLAVGAGRGRIARQMLAESAIIAALGGVVGLALAVWATSLLSSLLASAPASLGTQPAGIVARVAHRSACVAVCDGALRHRGRVERSRTGHRGATHRAGDRASRRPHAWPRPIRGSELRVVDCPGGGVTGVADRRRAVRAIAPQPADAGSRARPRAPAAGVGVPRADRPAGRLDACSMGRDAGAVVGDSGRRCRRRQQPGGAERRRRGHGRSRGGHHHSRRAADADDENLRPAVRDAGFFLGRGHSRGGRDGNSPSATPASRLPS